MDDQLLAYLAAFSAAGIVVLATGLVVLFRRVTAAQVEQTVRDIMPDGGMEGAAVWASMLAYKAVEQRANAWEMKSKEERLALALSWVEALVKLRTEGKLTPPAMEALIEYEVGQQHDQAA